jgi:hypothetical protein
MRHVTAKLSFSTIRSSLFINSLLSQFVFLFICQPPMHPAAEVTATEAPDAWQPPFNQDICQLSVPADRTCNAVRGEELECFAMTVCFTSKKSI